MSYLYFAQGLTVTIQDTVNVSAASNTSPIVITADDHGFLTGDIVQIAGVAGNTATNGSFVLTYLSANSFGLDNSNGNGAYTSGGVVTHVGHATPGVLVDETAFPTLPSFALQCRIEALAYFSVSVAFADAVDADFVTEQSLVTSQRIGPLGVASFLTNAPANCDSLFTATPADVPTFRIGQPNAYCRLKVYWGQPGAQFESAGIPGSSVTYSAWLAY